MNIEFGKLCLSAKVAGICGLQPSTGVANSGLGDISSCAMLQTQNFKTMAH